MGGGAPKEETRQQQQSWSNLNSVFGLTKDAAQSFGTPARADMDRVSQYFRNLFGGDSASTMGAVAPAVNAIKSGADTARRERATTGTSRTGGDTAENATADDRTRAAIDSLVASVKPAAADALRQISESQINAMLQSLGLGVNATGTVGGQVTSDINSRREASAKMWGSLISGAAQLATAPIGGTLLGKL